MATIHMQLDFPVLKGPLGPSNSTICSANRPRKAPKIPRLCAHWGCRIQGPVPAAPPPPPCSGSYFVYQLGDPNPTRLNWMLWWNRPSGPVHSFVHGPLAVHLARESPLSDAMPMRCVRTEGPTEASAKGFPGCLQEVLPMLGLASWKVVWGVREQFTGHLQCALRHQDTTPVFGAAGRDRIPRLAPSGGKCNFNLLQ